MDIDPRLQWDNLGYYYENKEDGTPFVGASRPDDVRYDFKTRKYCYPTPESWSDAKYNRHNELMYHRTPLFGQEIVEDEWLNPWGNPFAYNDVPHGFWGWDVGP